MYSNTVASPSRARRMASDSRNFSFSMDCREAGCFVEASSHTGCELRLCNRRFSSERLMICGFLDLMLPAIIGLASLFSSAPLQLVRPRMFSNNFPVQSCFEEATEFQKSRLSKMKQGHLAPNELGSACFAADDINRRHCGYPAISRWSCSSSAGAASETAQNSILPFCQTTH